MTLTDWIQAGASVVAVLVALMAYRVSKQSTKATVVASELSKQVLYASHRCIIYPERVNLVNSSHWQITIRNNGVGIAFNVEVQMYLRARLEQSAEPVPVLTNGSKVIAPQSNELYITSEGDLSLHIFEETPIIIRWEEMSGLKNEAQWYWSSNQHGDEKFSLKQHFKKEDSE